VNTPKSRFTLETQPEQAIGAVMGIRVPVYQVMGGQRSFGSSAIPLIRWRFHYAMAIRQSVASTG
jgi:hypothetical protein